MTGPLRWWIWIAGLVLAVAVGTGLALWRAPQGVVVPAAEGPASPGAPPASLPAPVAAPPVLAQADAPPPGVTPAQWAALRQELSGRPDELQRLRAHFTFADQLQRFRATPSTAVAERLALAQVLDAGLDERLRLREVGVGEARLIKSAVLELLQPDSVQRAQALRQWEAAMAAALPADTRHASDNAAFQRRQAGLVAAWQTQPAAARDARQLEQQLDALRQAHHGASTPGGAR
ncbi:hypothetical protein ACPOLB_19720 [Rubrivivax sp. RP6-9]|uniref:hypothetical protein n=1 Tax=Rubrivivax sp. RP6-9 TaxID=3415750 RepID=UPI003CC57410